MKNIVIVGAGSIGALKPDKYDSPKTKAVLTLAHAVFNDKASNLSGIVESNSEKARMASFKWSTGATSDIMFYKNKADIVCVCTPTSTHYEVLKQVLELKPKLVLAEKPFCETYEQAKEIHELYNKHNIPIAINFLRRYEDKYIWLKNAFDKKHFGQVYNVAVRYNRGIKHDACHAVDLLHWFMGDCRETYEFTMGAIPDRCKYDRSSSVFCSFDKCKNVAILPSDGRAFDIHEMDIICEHARIRIVEHGNFIKIYSPEKEPHYGNYLYMPEKYREVKTDLTTSLSNVIRNLVNYLDGTEQLLCTSYDALKLHRFYDFMEK